MLSDVFRQKAVPWSPKLIPGYAFHGITALLALWMFINAID